MQHEFDHTNNQIIKNLLDFIVKALDSNKAENLVSIDLSTKSNFADYMVIATGRSSRHVKSLAEKLRLELKNIGYIFNIEGLEQGEWVFVDADDILVHIFTKETREYYDLEQMWKS